MKKKMKKKKNKSNIMIIPDNCEVILHSDLNTDRITFGKNCKLLMNGYRIFSTLIDFGENILIKKYDDSSGSNGGCGPDEIPEYKVISCKHISKGEG